MYDEKQEEDEEKEGIKAMEEEEELLKSEENDIKELVTKLKDFNTGPKINPYRDSNYVHGVMTRGSEDSYLYNNRNINNKLQNYHQGN